MAYQRPVCPPLSPVVTQPTVVYQDYYIPQPVQVIHPVEVVNRYHCVPVPCHVVAYTCRDEVVNVCSTRGKRK